MLNSQLVKIKQKEFIEKAFSLYVRGFARRAVYNNGPIGTLLHSYLIYSIARRKVTDIEDLSFFISLTDAHHRVFTEFKPCAQFIDFRYRRKIALTALLSLRFINFIGLAISVAWALRGHRKSFQNDSWIQYFAASSQVASGIHLDFALNLSSAQIIIWGSDHCVITRTAILLNNSHKKHHFLPHGPCVGKDNIARDRSIFDLVYALNSFQKAVFLAWESTLKIKLLPSFQKKIQSPIKDYDRKGIALFLNQLDVGLRLEDGLSNELQLYVSKLEDNKCITVVVKNQQQLSRLLKEMYIGCHFFGFSSFLASHPPGSVECVIFSSGVSVDLLLEGYDLMLSSINPLVEDEKARNILGIPDPKTWRDGQLYRTCFSPNKLEMLNA